MLSGFIERLLDAPTIADIRAVFLEAVGQLGYDHALYAARFMLTVPRALLRDNPVVFSNLPPDLIEQAQRLRDLDQDPWVEWVRDNDGDITSDALQDQFGQSRSLGLAAEHGLGHARIISLRDKVLHSVGAVVVMPRRGADAQDLQASWARSGREVRVLSWVMHMRIATMQRNLPKATLTPRQREVLGWRSAGKTVGEIAVILGITAATVEKHIRLAREALGVETTPQAVLKAHVTHQLFQPAAASLRLGGQG
ncbi:helix-turn-helix transcriptional regulator [Paracoccus sp. (in: a-proteobacteria)]|uniref:helix-turn-helix transcriptional regulator n=1 Tax=Paracoccus sp. TaxID=267 RepID=UPI002729851F|nr:LuxR family transcriptional regulator [Paracoccus sp. (in: a-proteobacteria)]